MRRWLIWLAVSLMVIISSAVAQGQGAIRLLESSADYSFSEELRFRLVAEADAPITEVTLFYRPGWWATVSRTYPESFEPAAEVDITLVERVERGQIPPGTEIEYWWRLTDEAGNTFKSDVFTLFYWDDRFDWKEVERENIRFFAYGLDDAEAERLADISADALRRIAENFGVRPEMSIKIFGYLTSEDMREALVARGSVFEAQVITLGTVVAPDTMLLLATHPEVEPTIYHELTHVVVGLATENPFADLPAWLNEGLAMYNEGELRPGYQDVLDEAIRRDDVFSVRSLTSPTGNPERVNLWYAQVYSLVDYLISTYGREKMSELLSVFAEGELTDRALEQVYGFDQDELDRRWREWVGLPPREPQDTGAAEADEPIATPPPSGAEEETAPPDEPEGQPNPLVVLCPFLPGLIFLTSLFFWHLRRPG